MNPVSTSNGQDTKCSAIIGTNCVKWSGSALNCIEEVFKGDSLTSLITKIDNKICSVIESINIQSIDFSCIDFDGPGITLLSTLQTIINEHCLLKEAVEALAGGDIEECSDTWSGTMRCDTFWTIAGITPIPGSSTKEEMISYLTGAICGLNAYIEALEDRVEDLESAGGGGGGDAYIPPKVSSACLLFPINSEMDDAIEAIDAYICELKSAIGDVPDLESALNPPSIDGTSGSTIIENCLDDLDVTLGGSTTLAETMNQVWEVVSRLTLKVCELETALEACCKFRCKDLEIGIVAKLSDDRTEFQIYFTFNDALVIPADLQNCESLSTITLTDKNGTSITTSFDVAEPDVLNDEYLVIPVSGLDIDGGDISIKGEICVEHLNGDVVDASCFKCVEATLITSIHCEWCTISVSNAGVGAVSVYIEYTYPDSGPTANFTITAIGNYKIPYGSTILTIDAVLSDVPGEILIGSDDCPGLI
jgi:hypothetical protein